MAARRQRKVVSLTGVALPVPERNLAVLDELADLTREARDGHIVGLGAFVVRPNGQITITWAGNADQLLMVAGVNMLQHRLMAKFFEHRAQGEQS